MAHLARVAALAHVAALALILAASVARAAEAPKAGPRDVTTSEAEAWLAEHPETVILDVRTPEEFRAGHLPNATLLDFHADDFKKKLAALDKSKTYLVHCQSGARSARTRNIMVEMGFPRLLHMPGGFEAWQAEGKAVVAP